MKRVAVPSLLLLTLVLSRGAAVRHARDPACGEPTILTIRRELAYFALAEHDTGVFVDHVWYDPDGRVRRAEYTAPSKSGFQIAVCLQVMAGVPGFERGWRDESPPAAKATARNNLTNVLRILDEFQQTHSEYCGLFPWCGIGDSGLVPHRHGRASQVRVMLPAIDQGILAFSLLAVEWRLRSSAAPGDRSLASSAGIIRRRMDFSRYYDPLRGMMSGNLIVSDKSCVTDGHYWLSGPYSESVLPIMYAVLHDQVPASALRAVAPRSATIQFEGRTFHTFHGWRGSLHEVGIPLLFLPLNQGDMEDVYLHYLALHEAHAQRIGLPGLVATAYGIDGDGKRRYVEAGLRPIAEANHVSTPDSQGVFYATCLAELIRKHSSRKWSGVFLAACPPGPAGAWESVTVDGRHAPIYTTDAKAISVLSLSGGLRDDICGYLASKTTEGGRENLLQRYYSLVSQWLVLQPVQTPVPTEESANRIEATPHRNAMSVSKHSQLELRRNP